MRLQQGLLLLGVTGLITMGLSAPAGGGQRVVLQGGGPGAEDVYLPPLSRVREGGTPYNPNQSLRPYSIDLQKLRDQPLTGQIDSPPEYSPCQGVVFWYMTGHWPDVVTDLVANLTAPPEHDEIAYVVVTTSYMQSVAKASFKAAGADLDKIEYIIQPGQSVWMRDYGPHFIWQDGALAIVDSHYYPSRPLDNFCPTLLGDDYFICPTYDMGLYYSGGNFQPGPDRTGFCTSLMTLDNPYSQGFTEAFIKELLQSYQGVDTLHIMPQLPGSVDGTGHIDMWMYIVDENDVIISEFKPGSNPTAIQITDDAVPYMEDLGYTVHRPWAWNVGSTHYTYTNALRVNDRIFIPIYGEGYSGYLDEDAYALGHFEDAAGPAVEIIQIDCYGIIPAAGAIHCIVMQVPRRLDEVPAVNVLSPCGGELLVSGTKHSIQWAASDYYNQEIPTIDLYYSVDGGGYYEHIATTTDTGSYSWTVPEVETTEALIKVVATASDSDQGEAVSAEVFQISPATQYVYDFKTGALEDKIGYGYYVTSWTYGGVEGDRHPVDSEISTLVSDAYDRLADSDATGGDSDPNRYIPPTSYYCSLHTFEFTIDQSPAMIDDVGLLWEGYADDCAQAELYVWDYTEENWSNGDELYSQNRFMDSWAGNIDGSLEGHIRDDFNRYLDASGQMTLMVYAERAGDRAFHDYMSVTVTSIAGCPEDVTGDGVVDVLDLLAILAAWGDCPGCPEDITGDDVVDVLDLLAILAAWGSC